MAEELRSAEAERLARAEAATPFDLSAGELLRVKVLRVAAEEHMVLLTMHHIISDGWSMGVLIKEVGSTLPGLQRRTGITAGRVDDSVWRLCTLAAGVVAG